MKKFKSFILERETMASAEVHKVTHGDERGTPKGNPHLPKQEGGVSHTSKDTHHADEHYVIHHYSKMDDDGKQHHANIHATHKGNESGVLKSPEKTIKSSTEHKELTSKGFDHKSVSTQAVRSKEAKNYGAHVTARQQ